MPKSGSEIDPLRVPPRDDIVSIQIFWPNVIWLYDADQEPVGFQAPVYFVSGQTQRGVFVDGPIYVWMNEVTPGAGTRAQRTPLYEWKLEGSAETSFRVRRKVIGGYYYGLRLKWPAELSVEGKQVELAVGYKRRDGTIVKSLARRDEIVRADRRRMLPPAPPTTTETILLPDQPVSESQENIGAQPDDAARNREGRAAGRQPVQGNNLHRFRPVTGSSRPGQSNQSPPQRRDTRPRNAPTSQTVDDEGRPTVIVRTRLR